MPEPKLEQVFKLSGVPTHTFVKPAEYNRLLVSLRTPGRGIVIEGPSGIGKTSAVARALDELGLAKASLKLSARKRDDVDIIKALPELKGAGTVIVDDFHRLSTEVRGYLADFLKTLADEERADTKLVVIGIAKAGQALINFGVDLSTRLDVIPFEANPPERVRQIPALGERAMNISFNTIEEIVAASNGSFFIAQMLCHETCLQAQVLEAPEEHKDLESSFELTRARVLSQLSPKFMDATLKFASGPKLRREGRAPYLHILKWVAEASEWTIQLDREIVTHPDQRGGVGQVVEKGYLQAFIEGNQEFKELLHYEPSTHILAVQDPQFVFFLRNLPWNAFSRKVGYLNTVFPARYDFALSFAGSDRTVAQRLFELLTEAEVQVFYDKNEQHRMLAEDIEDYLGPIYRSEAAFVICLLGAAYPTRIWTKFESEQFRERFGSGHVIPILFSDAPVGMFDESNRVGGLMFDPSGNVDEQLLHIASDLLGKLGETRMTGPVNE